MMRVLLVVLLVAALTLSQGLAQRRRSWVPRSTLRQRSGDLESEPAAEERGRRRVECTTLDGLQGVCRRANRCPADRLALTNTETVCPGGRRRVKICCPRRRQGGNRGGGFNQGGTTSEINLGGSIGGASQGGSAGECGRSTPLTIWSRRRRAAQDGPSQPDKPTTPSLFEIRIVGGKNAEIGKWPWIALIGSKQGSRPPFWFCGGTLIASQYVLTAAHCLKPRAVNVAHLVIRLGEHDTSRTDEGTILQDLGVLSFANHENFQFPVLHDDISLIKLERPVVYTDFIKPVCLPPAPEGDYAGTVIDVAGWGYTEFKGESSEILQEVSLPVVGIQECQSKYESSSSFQVQFPGGFGETKLCAAEKGGGKDACQGDSGGPMVRQLADGRYELVGVVSAGVGCGTPGFPGLYTRVSAYLDWIRQKMV
ncbi:venom protease-like isoform X3 [Pollicipes pollicipes]|uniref:venom protease-like isoform X3 n=1 Tax=Pollicipes pollicipes TaxID=41117 RepID=UPI0018856528|nr:venom protease-like isoform X3 [Pollicipes pollicipes]